MIITSINISIFIERNVRARSNVAEIYTIRDCCKKKQQLFSVIAILKDNCANVTKILGPKLACLYVPSLSMNILNELYSL